MSSRTRNIFPFAVGWSATNCRAWTPPYIPVARGDTLILASDGVRGDFVKSLRLGESPQRVADRILAEFAPRTDDALVLVARYGK